MSGVFDYMNQPGSPLPQTINPAFFAGIVIRKVLSLSSNAELLGLVNTELASGGPLDAEAQSDFGDIIAWVEAGSGVEGKATRLGLSREIWGLYEQSQPDGTPWLTEAEARTAFTAAGVTFTFGT